MTAELWIKADGPSSQKERKELIISALESGIGTAIVRPEDSGFTEFGKIRLIFNDDGVLSDDTRIVTIASPKEQEEIMRSACGEETLIIDVANWKVIPLENLIAKFHGTGTKVMVCASTPEQVKLFSEILEKGVDGIVIDTADPDMVWTIAGSADSLGNLELTELTVEKVEAIEMGDRVCVDTVSMMEPGEGMLVGSQAACLFLVQSESEDNGYVAARPFRVNAGAVHAYIMGPGGKTRYLSELRSGDPLVIVGRDGKLRPTSIGRCKIERRPMLMVTASLSGRRFTTILQNAETVKLVGPEGSLPVTSLKPGDRVLARVDEGGRHFGMKVDETVREI